MLKTKKPSMIAIKNECKIIMNPSISIGNIGDAIADKIKNGKNKN